MSDTTKTTIQQFRDGSKYDGYSKYKGVDEFWSEMPEHWENIKLKHGYDVLLGKMLQTEQSASNDTLEPYLRTANVFWDGIDTSDVQEMWFSPEEKEQYRLQPGDLVVCEGGDVGRSAIWDGELSECYIQNAVHRVRPKDGNSNNFLYYWLYALKHAGYINLICSRATIAHLTSEKLERLPVVRPPLQEQQSIVEFLDEQTEKIDSLIGRKENLIELIREREEALITKFVTKGIKESRTLQQTQDDVVGELPENWKESKLGNITTNLTNGYVGPTRDILTDEGVPYIQSTHINNGEIEFSGEFFVSEEWSRNHRTSKLREGDVLLVQTGDVGESAVVREDLDGANCHALIIARPVDEVNSHYLNLFLESGLGKNLLKRTQTGATLKHLNTTRIKDVTIPVPPKEEQEEIVEFLESKRKRFASMIDQIETAIDHLKEYRTALITEAVTGQIDVRGEV